MCRCQTHLFVQPDALHDCSVSPIVQMNTAHRTFACGYFIIVAITIYIWGCPFVKDYDQNIACVNC